MIASRLSLVVFVLRSKGIVTNLSRISGTSNILEYRSFIGITKAYGLLNNFLLQIYCIRAGQNSDSSTKRMPNLT